MKSKKVVCWDFDSLFNASDIRSKLPFISIRNLKDTMDTFFLALKEGHAQAILAIKYSKEEVISILSKFLSQDQINQINIINPESIALKVHGSKMRIPIIN